MAAFPDNEMMQPKRIVIIGGGFSGAVTAVNLARLNPAPLHITVVDKNAVPCRGIAYSTRNSSHLLNVLARNMSALADQPNHFVEWLSTRSEYLDEPNASLREKFIPRRVYGDYLQGLCQFYSKILGDEKKMQLEFIQGESEDIAIENGTATVTLGGGKSLVADKVILAVGNLVPARFPLRGLDCSSPRFIGNPWIGWESRLPSPDNDLLLIGTGLTMVDTFLTLQDMKWRGKIIAVSRNGLLPLSHFKGFDYPDFLNDKTAAGSFAEIFALFKKNFRAAQAQRLNPAILVDKIRPFTQKIWQNFSLPEKKQFNRHFRTRWNVVRHRIAPEIHAQLTSALADGRFEIIKGRLRECRDQANGMEIDLASAKGLRTIKVGAVVNCTGPQENYIPSESALLNNLFRRGLVEPDEMNMGIKVAPDFAVMDRSEKKSMVLYGMGSIMKGTLWETTAVPELRSQAFRLAETIVRQLAESNVEKSSIAEVRETVLEFSI